MAGPNRTRNGLLLRADIHRLFDDGYVTVDPDLRFVVSPRLREEFENGRAYYALAGEALANLPERLADHPGREFLEWHNTEVYLGDAGNCPHTQPHGRIVTLQLCTGLYEDLLTAAPETESTVRIAECRWVAIYPADATARRGLLARHVHLFLRRALEAIPRDGDMQAATKIALANRIKQQTRGTKVVLFVRDRKKDGRGGTRPYHCLGRARYRSHESERPMKILWELERPMPGWLYQAGKVVAG